MAANGPFVTAACLCEKVLQEANGTLSLIRVVDRLLVNLTGPSGAEVAIQLPPSSLTLVIMLKSGQARGNLPVSVRTESPSGQRGHAITTTMLFQGGEQGMNLLMPLTLESPEEGVYWFDVTVEGELVTRIPLRVVIQRTEFGSGPPPHAPQPPSQSL